MNDYQHWITRGLFPGHTALNKYGRTTNADNGVITDIHDGANATQDVDIWVAPTQARVHNLTSTSANDDGDPVGTGARTVEVFGLTDWDTAEVSETVTMNGLTNAPTTNAYVIIHRMIVRTWGSAGPNFGDISATAVTDNSVTAMILASPAGSGIKAGQTQMTLVGIPSIQALHVWDYKVSYNKQAGATGLLDAYLQINPIPDSELAGFITKDTHSIITTGTTFLAPNFDPPLRFPGPLIAKLTVISSVDNGDISGNICGEIIDNNATV